MNKMKFEDIGSCQLEQVPPVIAMEKGNMFKPISFLYNEDKNLVLIFVLAPTLNMEWKIARIIENLYKSSKAKEILVVDGVSSQSKDEIYYASNSVGSPAFGKSIDNSIIMGVGAALLMNKEVPVTCIFGNLGIPTADAMADITSPKAAVKVIDKLNGYLGIYVDSSEITETGKRMENAFQNYVEKFSNLNKPDSTRYIG